MGRAGQSGFTLIEVVVALAIFALSASALYEVLGSAIRRNGQAQDRELALLRAQSLLSQQRVTPAPWTPEASGHSEDGWTWNIHVSPFSLGADPHQPWQAFEVRVWVAPTDAPTRGVRLFSVEVARSAP